MTSKQFLALNFHLTIRTFENLDESMLLLLMLEKCIFLQLTNIANNYLVVILQHMKLVVFEVSKVDFQTNFAGAGIRDEGALANSITD